MFEAESMLINNNYFDEVHKTTIDVT